MKLNKYLLFLVLAALMAIVAACGADSNEETPDNTDSSTPDTEANGDATDAAAALEGSVVIDGSGTVYPLMAKIAEEYMLNEQENVSVEVSRAGTSAGFKKFLVENGTDFNDASRNIKDEEQAEADKNIAQAKAEERRAMAVASEQEMKAKVEEMRAKVVSAEAEVPMAMADALRSGNIGIMDYVNYKNVQADTSMRESISKYSQDDNDSTDEQ